MKKMTAIFAFLVLFAASQSQAKTTEQLAARARREAEAYQKRMIRAERAAARSQLRQVRIANQANYRHNLNSPLIYGYGLGYLYNGQHLTHFDNHRWHGTGFRVWR